MHTAHPFASPDVALRRSLTTTQTSDSSPRDEDLWKTPPLMLAGRRYRGASSKSTGASRRSSSANRGAPLWLLKGSYISHTAPPCLTSAVPFFHTNTLRHAGSSGAAEATALEALMAESYTCAATPTARRRARSSFSSRQHCMGFPPNLYFLSMFLCLCAGDGRRLRSSRNAEEFARRLHAE